jgi:hypothetical protein
VSPAPVFVPPASTPLWQDECAELSDVVHERWITRPTIKRLESDNASISNRDKHHFPRRESFDLVVWRPRARHRCLRSAPMALPPL